LNTISRVQELADERGLTLCQLSKICDLSEATIRTAKKRGNQLSVDTIERICEALDISLSDFFAETLPK
jgi:DNA-binding Xre family transcriptional regulator